MCQSSLLLFHFLVLFFFFFNDTATTEIYTLSLHDALPIFSYDRKRNSSPNPGSARSNVGRSAGIVTSRFPIPVPPFVTITSQVHEACSTASRIGFDSSFTTTEKSTE